MTLKFAMAKMKCLKCEKQKFFGDFCRKCFCEIVEKRIRKEIRYFGLKKSDMLIVPDETTKRILKRVLKMPITIVIKKKRHTKVNEKFNRVKKSGINIDDSTMDKTGLDFMERFFKPGYKIKKTNKNKLRIFASLTSAELEKYCEIKKIKIKKTHKEHFEENEMLQRMEYKYPGTINSLAKSVRALEERIPKK